ncbi:MAG: DnaJ domain-containing protein [Chloroflexi bacterium]|nr:DnaJ domain-containing protein [Chloroflexota bacterium]
MTGELDYYAILGVPRNASEEDIRRAYREAALRLHPDKNEGPEAVELFLQINRAYELLSDADQRAAYDQELKEIEAEMISKASFGAKVIQSRKKLLQLDEPQVHYLLIDIEPSHDLPEIRPPINLAIVIDRSTSMRGRRLDQLRNATLKIMSGLNEGDSTSIIAFSDRAELIVSPDQARDRAVARARLSLLQAGGGTEIAQGLRMGLGEIDRYFSREGINHLILLTDGRTYGDENECIQMADAAALQGITIHGIGIGSDWSDRLLDDLASRTGGDVAFLDTPEAIVGVMEDIFEKLSHTVASRLRLEGSVAQQVDLRSTFRLLPEPMPMGDSLPLTLGNLPRDGIVRVLLEMVIHPIGKISELTLAHFTIDGDILGKQDENVPLPLEVLIPVSDEPDMDPPSEEITAALSQISLYRMQEKARHEAELGQSAQAARRLENLATQLLASGERELAKSALSEADRLAHSRRLSSEGEKVLKYGTRALMIPARTGESES